MSLKLCAAYGRNITSFAPLPPATAKYISSRPAHQCTDEEEEQESPAASQLRVVGEES